MKQPVVLKDLGNGISFGSLCDDSNLLIQGDIDRRSMNRPYILVINTFIIPFPLKVEITKT